MHTVKVAIFDFDGVILNSKDLHYHAMQQFFNISLSEEDFAKMHDGNFFDHKLAIL